MWQKMLQSGGSGSEKNIQPLVPKMTSNTAPSGYEAFALTEYGTSTKAFYAFAKNISSQWQTAANSTPSYIAIKFPTASHVKRVDFIEFNPANGSTYVPCTIYVEGSTDRAFTNPQLIGQIATTSDTKMSVNYIDCEDANAYQYFRLRTSSENAKSSSGSKYVVFAYVQFNGYE